jgi:hypothetical protein
MVVNRDRTAPLEHRCRDRRDACRRNLSGDQSGQVCQLVRPNESICKELDRRDLAAVKHEANADVSDGADRDIVESSQTSRTAATINRS